MTIIQAKGDYFRCRQKEKFEFSFEYSCPSIYYWMTDFLLYPKGKSVLPKTRHLDQITPKFSENRRDVRPTDDVCFNIIDPLHKCDEI